eukprot:3238273-Rhodomonas_salina.2
MLECDLRVLSRVLEPNRNPSTSVHPACVVLIVILVHVVVLVVVAILTPKITLVQQRQHTQALYFAVLSLVPPVLLVPLPRTSVQVPYKFPARVY